MNRPTALLIGLSIIGFGIIAIQERDSYWNRRQVEVITKLVRMRKGQNKTPAGLAIPTLPQMEMVADV